MEREPHEEAGQWNSDMISGNRASRRSRSFGQKFPYLAGEVSDTMQRAWEAEDQRHDLHFDAWPELQAAINSAGSGGRTGPSRYLGGNHLRIHSASTGYIEFYEFQDGTRPMVAPMAASALSYNKMSSTCAKFRRIRPEQGHELCQ